MGYEINYSFYPRKQEGIGYDTENPQVFTKQLGKMEEVPVEKLANTIMMQLARRDIMVFDVTVFEYSKKQISFKETKGGILIKNKKFLLDGTIEVVEEPPEPQQQQQIQAPQRNQAIRWEVYDPDPGTVAMMMNKYRLTPRKKYPIMEEKTIMQRVNLPGSGITEMPAYEYLVIDDTGARVRVPSMNFMPEQKGLIGMEEFVRAPQDNAPRLMHMGNGHDNGMPVLRR